MSSKDRSKEHGQVEFARRDFLKLGGASLAMMGGRGLFGRPGLSALVPQINSKGDDFRISKTALKVAIPSNPLALDPVKYNDVQIVESYSLVVEPLYVYGANKEAVPLLASGLAKSSADLMQWTIPLRKGVKFHNGKEFTSADVKYTFEQIMNPAVASFQAAFLNPVASIDSTNPYEIVLNLKIPFAYLMDNLVSLPIVPSNVPYTATTYATSLIGTGPFRFVNWQQNVAIKYAKNHDYWQKGVPTFDSVTFEVITETATQVAEIASGNIQMLTTVSPALIKDLKKHNVAIYESPLREAYFINPNLATGPMSNVNVRLAVSWAIDRGAIARDVFDGYATPESTNPARGMLYYDEELGSFFGDKPDIAKAKSYLSQAPAITQPFQMVVLDEDPNLVSAMTIVQENLAAIGIQAQIQLLGQTPALTKLFSGQYDLWCESQGVSPSPVQPYLVFTPGSSLDFNHANDPSLAALVAQVVGTPGAVQARTLMHAVQRRFVEYCPWIMCVTCPYVFARVPSLTGLALNTPSNLHGLANAYIS